jgi:beta-galactosidase
MKIFRIMAAVFLYSFVHTADLYAQEHLRDTISLNGTWDFKTDLYKNGVDEFWYNNKADKTGWSKIPVPGNWDTQNEYADYAGDAWYRRAFIADSSWKGKEVNLVFQSVYNDAEIWLNGVRVGENHFGFLEFKLDISSYLNYQTENLLVVKVNNLFKRGAIWNWGGIRRPLWLQITNKTSIQHSGIDAVPDLKSGKAMISYAVEVANKSAGTQAGLHLGISVYYKGKSILSGVQVPVFDLAAGDVVTVKKTIDLPHSLVHLWDFDHPELYTTIIRLYKESELISSAAERFGIRKIEVDGEHLKLNGNEVRPVGFNLVPEDRVTGNTLPAERIKKMVDMLKASGANMARLSHVSLPKEFLDYLDEKGIMIFEEVSLWGRDALVDADNPLPKIWLQKLVKQEYNHPCIIGWSVGNEIGYNAKAYDYIKSAIVQAKQLNPGRLAVYISHSAFNQKNDAAVFSDVLMINAYDNWGEKAEKAHANFPGKPIFFSEYGAHVNTEQFDDNAPGLDAMLAEMRRNPFVIGGSLWTFNDYRSLFYAKGNWDTPASQNRSWGVVNSFLQPKKAYNKIRRAYLPLVFTRFTVVREAHFIAGEIQLKARGQHDFPAYPLNGYELRACIQNAAGVDLAQQNMPLPLLNPGDPVKNLNFKLPVPAGAAKVKIELKDPQQYSRYDTLIFLKKPEKPEIIKILTSSTTARIYFKQMPLATSYTVSYGLDSLDQATPATLYNFIDIKNPGPGKNYKYRLVAHNNAGDSSTDVDTLSSRADGELPPVIWADMWEEGSLFVSYAVEPTDYRFEIAYGSKPNKYDKALTLSNKGVLQVPGLEKGKRYYFKMRRLSQSGAVSKWSPEMSSGHSSCVF